MARFLAVYAILALIGLSAALYSYMTFVRAGREGTTATPTVPEPVPGSGHSESAGTSTVPEPAVPQAALVRIGGTNVRVTIADTPEKRTRGLSGMQSLDAGEGMLFVFPEDGVYGFWMKDMRFSIDILWLSAEGEVVHIVENASPESYPTSFMPDSYARYVLEVPAGFAKAHNVAVGETAVLPR